MFFKTAALLALATFATSTFAMADPTAAATAAPAAAVAPILAPVGPPASDAIQKLITAQYALTCSLVLDPSDKNMDTGFATMATGFVDIDTKGNQLTRDEVIANAKQQLKTFHGTDCNNTFDSMTATDANTVVAICTQKVTGDIQAPDGKHDLDLTSKTQDTWKLQSGTWLETQSREVHVVVKVDGNVVQDMGGR